jgi:lipopolysaccharide export system ATP-binding protein
VARPGPAVRPDAKAQPGAVAQPRAAVQPGAAARPDAKAQPGTVARPGVAARPGAKAQPDVAVQPDAKDQGAAAGSDTGLAADRGQTAELEAEGTVLPVPIGGVTVEGGDKDKNSGIIIPAKLHVLKVTDLHKRFGRKEVVRGVNFSMYNGEVAGLLGPNGAGKTTIFYMIVGFYKPSLGHVSLDDVNISRKPMFRRARQGIAYLPQEASIFRKLTVEQNIWAILESRRDLTKKKKKQRLEFLLEEFGITRIRHQLGYTLSGGERRRTEIARALATEPKFLLLDEPFAGIDPIAVYEIKQIIRRLAETGIGILITDHNVRDTLEITTEAFIINEGTIVARGDRDVILADEMVRKIYLGSEFKM